MRFSSNYLRFPDVRFGEEFGESTPEYPPDLSAESKSPELLQLKPETADFSSSVEIYTDFTSIYLALKEESTLIIALAISIIALLLLISGKKDINM